MNKTHTSNVKTNFIRINNNLKKTLKYNMIHIIHEINESIIRQQDFERRLQTLPSKVISFAYTFYFVFRENILRIKS